jgi:hypothetical protein
MPASLHHERRAGETEVVRLMRRSCPLTSRSRGRSIFVVSAIIAFLSAMCVAAEIDEAQANGSDPADAPVAPPTEPVTRPGDNL